MQHIRDVSELQTVWNAPPNGTRSLSPSSSKVVQILVNGSLESPETILGRLESVSGRIRHAAMCFRADGGGKPQHGNAVSAKAAILLSLKVEFVMVEAAQKALSYIQGERLHLGHRGNTRDLVASYLAAFSVDDDDILLDLGALHNSVSGVGHEIHRPYQDGRARRGGHSEQRTSTISAQYYRSATKGPGQSNADGASRTSMEQTKMTRPLSCGSEAASYASSSTPSAGSSVGSAPNGRYISRDDALYSRHREPPNPDYGDYPSTNPMSLRVSDILDDYDDLASEISKFELITPTNDHGYVPWKDNNVSANWGGIGAAVAGVKANKPYLHPWEVYASSRSLGGELFPGIPVYSRPGIARDEFTPRASPPPGQHRIAISRPMSLQRFRSPSLTSYEHPVRGNPRPFPEAGPLYNHQHASSTSHKPQHTRDSSFSSTTSTATTTTSQSRHSDHRSYDSKSTSSHSSTSKRSRQKSNQDKRVYAEDPHKGPRPTDWMLSEETLKTRAARDARFAQIVAAGQAPGRTKAGWTQARRPGKRDRDAAKAKLREMEEEKERERLRELLGEDTRSSRATTTGLAC